MAHCHGIATPVVPGLLYDLRTQWYTTLREMIRTPGLRNGSFHASTRIFYALRRIPGCYYDTVRIDHDLVRLLRHAWILKLWLLRNRKWEAISCLEVCEWFNLGKYTINLTYFINVKMRWIICRVILTHSSGFGLVYHDFRLHTSALSRPITYNYGITNMLTTSILLISRKTSECMHA